MSHADLVDHARNDLSQIVREHWLIWCHSNAYFATKPDRDRPSGPPEAIRSWVAQLAAESTERKPRPSDQVVGDGDPRSRVAWHESVSELAAAHDCLVAATWAWDVPFTEGTWPLTQPAQNPLEAESSARSMLIRLGRPVTDGKALAESVRHVATAWHALSAVFLAGRADQETQAVGEPCTNPHGKCPNPSSEKEAGGRCRACGSWRRRNTFERPESVCTDGVDEARAAQARRLARGDSFGDEGLSCTTLPPIVIPRPAPTFASPTAMITELEAAVAGLRAKIAAGHGDVEDRLERNRLEARIRRLTRQEQSA